MSLWFLCVWCHRALICDVNDELPLPFPPPQPPYHPQGGLIGGIALEVGGVSPLWPQPGNRFVSFVRASGRGEAKLRGRARGDSILVLGLFWGKRTPTAPAPPKPCPGVVREFFDVWREASFNVPHFALSKFELWIVKRRFVYIKQWIITTFRGQPCKTNAKSTLFADNLVKPMKNQHFSRTTL